ncbi:MAG TPA: hypothetical protein VFJ19_03755 [Nocardioidaceae bacterium]|nr:hypothetical protein [Nocardioidaceae bacterium]
MRLVGLVVLGVALVAALVGSWAHAWRVWSRSLRALRERRRMDDGWRRVAPTLSVSERWCVMRAASSGTRVDDPRLAELVVRRARYVLRTREVSARHGMGPRWYRRVFTWGALDLALGGGLVLASYLMQHRKLLLFASVYLFAVALYAGSMAWVYPSLYRRGDRQLRRTLETNDP